MDSMGLKIIKRMKLRGKHVEGDMGGSGEEGMGNVDGFDSLNIFKNIKIRPVVCGGA